MESRDKGEICEFRNPWVTPLSVSSAQFLQVLDSFFLPWGPNQHCWNLSITLLEPITLPSSDVLHHTPGARSLKPQVLSAQDPGTRGMENKAPPSTPQVQHPLLLPSSPHPCLGLVLQITTQPFRAWQGPLRCLIQMARPLNRK